jgi:hypothetical protein
MERRRRRASAFKDLTTLVGTFRIVNVGIGLLQCKHNASIGMAGQQVAGACRVQ